MSSRSKNEASLEERPPDAVLDVEFLDAGPDRPGLQKLIEEASRGALRPILFPDLSSLWPDGTAFSRAVERLCEMETRVAIDAAENQDPIGMSIMSMSRRNEE